MRTAQAIHLRGIIVFNSRYVEGYLGAFVLFDRDGIAHTEAAAGGADVYLRKLEGIVIIHAILNGRNAFNGTGDV